MSRSNHKYFFNFWCRKWEGHEHKVQWFGSNFVQQIKQPFWKPVSLLWCCRHKDVFWFNLSPAGESRLWATREGMRIRPDKRGCCCPQPFAPWFWWMFLTPRQGYPPSLWMRSWRAAVFSLAECGNELLLWFALHHVRWCERGFASGYSIKYFIKIVLISSDKNMWMQYAVMGPCTSVKED